MDISPFVEQLTAQGCTAIAIQTEITDYASVQQAIDQIITLWGGIDILVNNAATISREGVLEMSLETWHAVLDVNVNAAFYCSKAVISYLSSQKSGQS
jgi:NAD(P)-dependent dehydrogenase (short-subunit alcohol dehydrogenase family)